MVNERNNQSDTYQFLNEQKANIAALELAFEKLGSSMSKTMLAMLTKIESLMAAQQQYSGTMDQVSESTRTAGEANKSWSNWQVANEARAVDQLKALHQQMSDAAAKGDLAQLEAVRAHFDQLKAETTKQLFEIAKNYPEATIDTIALYREIAILGEQAGQTKTRIQTLGDAFNKLGIPVPKSIKDVSTLADIFKTKLSPAMIGVYAAVLEAIKQLWSFGADSTKNFTTLARTGGLMNSSWETSIHMAVWMQNAWVSFGDTLKVTTGLIDENAFMLNSYIGSIDASTGAVRYNEAQLSSNQIQLEKSSAYLAKMGPLYGLSMDQIGKAFGGVISRFHISTRNMGKSFDAIGKMAMGTGISMQSWLETLTSVGNTLRWVNVPLETVISRFSQLTLNMQMMGQQAGQFWREIQPGEMLDMMKSITQAWQNVNSSLYLALKPGAIPTTLTEYSKGLMDFYSKEPIEMMKMMADKYTEIFSKMGLAPETSRMFIAQMPGFQEMGRMGPRVIELLTGMTSAQLETSGAGKDMNKLMATLEKRFPGQKENIEAFRQAQIGMQEPLEMIARTLVMMFRFLARSPLLLAGAPSRISQASEEVRQLETDVLGRYPGARRSHTYDKLFSPGLVSRGIR